MDLEHSRSRTASQTSLSSNYQAHGNSHCTPSRPPGQRRPLRSLADTSNMLRSPGPLESMLKTTTETGDIGIFSIRPVAPSMTYHHSPRPKIPFGDESLLARPRSRATDDGSLQDDRKRLPSYRDTTSEIISLYGSSTQASHSRSFSPSLEGRRSYSMTTCSSRQIPFQKSSCTLQSLPSAGALQRSRSPFPYPARLKRPGVRPASPAITESGSIDYTRMVELDRASLRTIHGPYRPTPPQGHRKPPPLSLRSDLNKSTSSLSSQSPGPYQYGPGPNRARTPSSSRSRTPRPMPCQQQRVSTDQSARSSSLTSIVEMYQRPIQPSRTGPPLRSTGSFYYDYTEEFETDVQPQMDISAPLCPVPQRANSFRRPMVLREDGQAHLHDGEGQEEAFESTSQEQSSTEGNATYALGESEVHISADDADCTIVKAKTPVDAPSTPPPSGSPERTSVSSEIRVTHLESMRESSSSAPPTQACNTESHSEFEPASEPPSASKSIKNLSRRSIWRKSIPLGASFDPANASNKKVSQSSLTRFRWTLDPALSEFASMMSSLDKLAKAPFGKKEDGVSTSCEAATQLDEPECDNETSALNPPSVDEEASVRKEGTDSGQAETPFPKCHRRRPAATRISMSESCASQDIDSLSPAANEKPPILSPQPISPVRQLRVSNSIPHLMNSLPLLPPLPPLPDDMAQVHELPDDGSSLTNTEVPTNILFTSPVKPPARDPRQTEYETSTPKATCANNQVGPVEQLPPKLKLRVKPSHSPMMQDGIPERTSSNTAIPKLKLKVSQSKLGQNRVQPGTVARKVDLKQYDSLTRLVDCPMIEISRHDYDLRENFHRETDPGFQFGNLKPIEEKPAMSGLPPRLCEAVDPDLSYLPGPAKPDTKLLVTTGQQETSPVQHPRSKVPPVGHRGGLRQKLSLLRLRSGGSHTLSPKGDKHDGEVPAFQDNRAPEVSYMIFDDPVSKCGVGIRHRGMSTRTNKRGGKVRRWAVEARRAVRSCVKRTLDRSSSGGE